MITSATTPAQQAEFARRIAGKPYFAAVMGTALTLFGQKPGSGWSFYLLPGGALALRGGTATLCGALPNADTAEELQSFLQFVCTDRILTEQPLPFGTEAPPLTLWRLPKGGVLPLPPAPPAALTLTEQPAMLPVSRLAFADKAQADGFYSAACTAMAHGIGCCHALLQDGTPVCTVGCFSQSKTESYMSAGVTAPAWRGKGLAGWLIVRMANELAQQRDAVFACEQALNGWYRSLGFRQNGIIQQYITDWNTL